MHRRSVVEWLLATTMLAGCATMEGVDPQYHLDAAKGTGLVLFTVTHNHGAPDPFFGATTGAESAIWFKIRGEKLGGNDVVARSWAEGQHGASDPIKDMWGRVYVRELPAGRYEVFAWDISSRGAFLSWSMKSKVAPPPLAFEVKAGSAVYIGSLHGAMRYQKNIAGVEIVVDGRPEIRNAADRDIPLILKSYPQLTGMIVVAPLPTGPWSAN